MCCDIAGKGSCGYDYIIQRQFTPVLCEKRLQNIMCNYIHSYKCTKCHPNPLNHFVVFAFLTSYIGISFSECSVDKPYCYFIELCGSSRGRSRFTKRVIPHSFPQKGTPDSGFFKIAKTIDYYYVAVRIKGPPHHISEISCISEKLSS